MSARDDYLFPVSAGTYERMVDELSRLRAENAVFQSELERLRPLIVASSEARVQFAALTAEIDELRALAVRLKAEDGPAEN